MNASDDLDIDYANWDREIWHLMLYAELYLCNSVGCSCGFGIWRFPADFPKKTKP